MERTDQNPLSPSTTEDGFPAFTPTKQEMIAIAKQLAFDHFWDRVHYLLSGEDRCQDERIARLAHIAKLTGEKEVRQAIWDEWRRFSRVQETAGFHWEGPATWNAVLQELNERMDEVTT